MVNRLFSSWKEVCKKIPRGHFLRCINDVELDASNKMLMLMIYSLATVKTMQRIVKDLRSAQ